MVSLYLYITPRPEAVAARYKNRSWRTTSPNGLARRMVVIDGGV
jgi:hypothetical protein